MQREADVDDGLRRPGDVARQALDQIGMHAGLLLGRRRRELGGFGTRPGENRGDFDGLAVAAFHLPGALQRRLELAQAQAFAEMALAAGHRLGGLRRFVPAVEDVGFALVAQVAVAQQFAGFVTDVGAHQEGQVGLLAHEGCVDELVAEQHVQHREREKAVGARLHRYPVGGELGGGVVLGRDAPDARAVVARLSQVVGIGNARHRGVDAPQHDGLGVEPGVERMADGGDAVGQRGAGEHVADGAGRIQPLRAEQRTQPQRPGAAALREDAGAAVEHQRTEAVLLQGVDDVPGDVGQRFVPGDTLPLAFAARAGALHRMQQAVGLDHLFRMHDALVAAARIGVGNLRIDLRIGGGLLLAGDLSILGEHAPGAIALAVRAVEGEALRVATRGDEFAAVEVFPGPVGASCRAASADFC